MDTAYNQDQYGAIAIQQLTSGHGRFLYFACGQARESPDIGGWAQGPAEMLRIGGLPGMTPGRLSVVKIDPLR